MSGATIYEFDTIVAESAPHGGTAVPVSVFTWLERMCLNAADEGKVAWLRLTQRRGQRAVQVTSFVGVIRAPNGFQIEVLPKIGKASDDVKARQLLIEMLRCLNGFRHIQTDNAQLAATKLPLLEVFIGEFLLAVEHIVKRGLRSDYVTKQDNIFVLRGKLLVAQQLRQNLYRADRFFTEHDKFSPNRPENRLLNSALRQVLSISISHINQRLARELCFVFDDIPESAQIAHDFQRVRLDRGMGYYADALAWAKLILEDQSPLTGVGARRAPSLLFPMEAVFEAYVAKHLSKQVSRPFVLKKQARSYHLVQHQKQNWFRLKPDLLIKDGESDLLVLDTKWKLLDSQKSNGTDKYQLSQADFYQLYAYGQHYLDGRGDVVLIYPKTDSFSTPLPVFSFPQAKELRLWVLPFCLKTRRLLLPALAQINELFTIVDNIEKQPAQKVEFNQQ